MNARWQSQYTERHWLGFPEQCHFCRGALNLKKEVGKPLLACWQPEEESQDIRVLPKATLIAWLVLFSQLSFFSNFTFFLLSHLMPVAFIFML